MRSIRVFAAPFIVSIVLGSLGLGCTDSEAPPVNVEQKPGDGTGYFPGIDVVVADGVSWVITGGGNYDGCVKIGEDCVDIGDLKQQECGDRYAQADIVIVEGQVVKVICYPPKSEGRPIDELGIAPDGSVELPQNENGAIITFDPATDGKSIVGNVRLDAERVVLIGNGVDKTIIGGNLNLASNNAHVRGLTIEGNVTIEKDSNNNSITFCRIYGNLEIEGNGATVINCDVFGNVKVNGNGATLLGLRVAGNFDGGSGATCKGNVAIDDKDKDFVVDPLEVGAALTCP